MRNDDITKAVYTGNGVTTRWSIPFDYFAESEIHVLLTVTAAGLEQETEVDSDSFTIDEDAKEIVYPNSAGEEPVPAGTKLTVYRSTDTLQQADYTNQGAMWPETLEGSLDKIHQVLQEHSEGLARSFTVSMSSNKTPKEYADELIAGSIAAVEAASAAAQSETNAATSATAAAGSASAALASQQAASTSETNAAASATAAAQSATDLETAVQAAAASASAAAGSASAAATSEINAATSASAALTSQQAAANSATAAATSETNAGTSATNAANSATAAAASATHADNTAASIDYHAGYRQPSTVYADGAMATHHALPYGWFMTCTTNGTTSSGALVIPSPVAEGDTITDGDVEWTVKKIGTGNGDGFAVGDIIMIAGNNTIRDGWLECDGRAVSRTMFPDLFDVIGTTYGAGDGSTTFNLPNYSDGKFPEGSTVAGVVKQPGLPNITGSATGYTTGGGSFQPYVTTSGAFNIPPGTEGKAVSAPDNMGKGGSLILDASLSSPIYGASNTVQPYSCTTRFIIKAYDGVTPTPAEADISEMLTELTSKADRRLSNLDKANLACHVVVDSYYDDTTGDWYRVYDDGWIEQGGAFATSNIAINTITFLKAFVDNNYTVLDTLSIQNAYNCNSYVETRTQTTMDIRTVNGSNQPLGDGFGTVLWYACGQGASV